MNLSKEQKSDLRSLTEHRGFRLLEEILEGKKASLLNEFMTADLWQESTRQRLFGVQNYVWGMESLLKTAKWLTVKKVDRVESLR